MTCADCRVETVYVNAHGLFNAQTFQKVLLCPLHEKAEAMREALYAVRKARFNGYNSKAAMEADNLIDAVFATLPPRIT